MKNDPPRLKRVTDAMLMTLPPPDDWDDPQSSNAPGAWPVMSLVKQEHTVGSDSQPTVGSVPEPTVGLESEPTVLAGVFYLAEDLGALFPVTRVKRIDRAQDALTAKEEAVYDAIWKSGDAQQGLSTWSYTDLASHKDVRSDKRNVAKLVRRLVQKGFIEIVRQGGGARTQKTVYRAFGYGPVLQAQRRRGICGVVKTGNGVFYAIKVVLPGPLTVGSGSGPTVVPGLEPTVDRRSEPTVDRRPPHTSLVQNTVVQGQPPSSSLVEATPEFDDDARRQLVAACRRVAPDITEDEIAESTTRKQAQFLAGRKQIDNLVGLLLTAVPKCFAGGGLDRYRAGKVEQDRRSADEARRQELHAAELRAEHERTIEDPGASQEARDWARECLGLLKTG